MSYSADFMSEFTRSTLEKFQVQRTVMSFQNFLAEVEKEPKKHLRGASQYFSDMFAYFGHDEVQRPTGTIKRWRLFNAPFDQGDGKVLGQERVQNELLRNIHNFVKAGRCDRLVLLHGPNGSAKTSIARLIARAAEVYSELDEGALYRFNWVFPLKNVTKGSFGFSGAESASANSYANLDEEHVEARITCEMNDHPLLLLERSVRMKWINAVLEKGGIKESFALSDLISKGDLSTKNKRIFQALLNAYLGDLGQVLRHVQVERFHLSQRYRVGLSSVEPQMSVDAFSRQVTMDQSLAALPASLRHLSLFETGGPLVTGNRGIVEYNDLLKRPIEAWKYLLVATELGQVNVDNVTLFFDSLMLASSNELHLQGFREYPDWQSFKGRIELVKVPYLLSYQDELQIYKTQIPKYLHGMHIAPHALEVAARWAVLTRLEPPLAEKYDFQVRDLVHSLSPLEKLELYDTGTMPERLTQMEARELRNLLHRVFHEYDDELNYEGRFGASPREIRTLILSASQNPAFDHLSPIAVLDGIANLIREKSSYEFLRREGVRGYRDALSLLEVARDRYVKDLRESFRMAIGLVGEQTHTERLMRYILNVKAWTKGEKLFDPLTKKMMDPDLTFLAEIEKIILPMGESQIEFRKSLISQIAARILEEPDREIDYNQIFSNFLNRLREDYYSKQQSRIEYVQNAYLKMIGEGLESLDPKDQELVTVFKKNLFDMGYNESSAKNAISYLLKSC